MSLGDDNGYGNDSGRTDDAYSTIGGTRQTRTRLPDGEGGDGYNAPRRPARASRSLITMAGVVVLLIGAIAFANMGGGDGNGNDGDGSGNGGSKPEAASTAATGTKPVTGKNGTTASGFAHDNQGAQSAAANYAVALVSADILKPAKRAEIVRQVFIPSRTDELETKFNQAYSKEFLDEIGLDENGNAATGMTYVSRTAPVGTKVTESSGSSTTVDVWCTGVFGTAGVSSTNPVSNDWFTMTLKLQWDGSDWKVDSFSQKEGPAPVNTDRTASNADEIAKAVEEYGGFTYAR
ncbi:hypothetical protein OIC43_21345 [Streptomyces sp. NBC_00825]|uniref:hypothetical protein n=1 Tax=unclassified Streptomyces TaxID=2593676 RepID=UPI002ED3552B|nr:hypothetical protein OG832_22350 [Streptomyces sp. NBC_00826]WTH91423.1 hypothetical protein OIC43_21345 [Streptomyces sp. NBC_00825]WTI00150.1 hypothetical protein OHA23_21330 [Streptomyces sp. NBC_00822]